MEMRDLYKHVSKGETVWCTYVSQNKEILYVITSKVLRETYFMYEVVDGKLVKTKYKAENPLDLEKYMSRLKPDSDTSN